jgi:hypothetical protein
MIGHVGTTFGDAKVNIADMAITRDISPDGTAHALMLLKVDSVPGPDVVEKLRKHSGILRVKTVTCPPRGA